MHVAIRIFWAVGIVLLAQGVGLLFGTFNFLRYMRWGRTRPLNDFTPRVALIIPCKGLEADFESNVSSFLCQDYPDCQVIFTVASVNDPAYQALRSRLEKVSNNKQNKEVETACAQGRGLSIGGSRERQNGGVATALLVAGYSESRTEKVHNQLQALKVVDAEAEVLVFADIDARPSRDWLRALVAPLQDPQTTVSTGFRWYLPGLGFASHLRGAWNALIATLQGDHEYNFAWGGSMAVRTIDFKRLGVAERYWANAVTDDLTLTRAVREAGGRIWFEPRCLVASRQESKFGEFLKWSNRQFIITRVCAPGRWWLVAGSETFFCGAVLFGLIMLVLPGTPAWQRLLIAGILFVNLLLAMGRGRIHTTIAKELFPEEAPSLSRYGARYWQLRLLVPWVLLINILVSSVKRRIEWCGTHYDLRGRNETRVILRER